MTTEHDPNRHLDDHWPANVVPAIDELIALRQAVAGLTTFPHPHQASQAGRHSSRIRGRGMDFEESRPYQPGDDIRTIDWRVTARTTRPHTKVFTEERERPVYVLVDLRSNMFLGSDETKSVAAARMAAALAWATLKRGDRIGALVFGDREQCDIRPRRSHHQALRLIRALRDQAPRRPATTTARLSLHQMSEELLRVAGSGATVFVISDFHDQGPDSTQQLSLLSRHHQVVPVLVYDRLEQQLPPPGVYPVGDGDRVLQLHTDQPRQRAWFEQAFQHHLDNLEQQAIRMRSRLLHCPTGSDTGALLNRYFGTRLRSPTS